MKLILVVLLTLLATAQDAAESSVPVYENMRHRIHVFYDSITYESNQPDSLAERTISFLRSRDIEFETINGKNFQSGDFM